MVDNRIPRPPSNRPATRLPVPGRVAATHVDNAEHLEIDLPLIGALRLPRPEQLAYYGAVGVLLALEVIDWPVAILIAAGHALANQQHNRAIQEFGEGLQDADR